MPHRAKKRIKREEKKERELPIATARDVVVRLWL